MIWGFNDYKLRCKEGRIISFKPQYSYAKRIAGIFAFLIYFCPLNNDLLFSSTNFISYKIFYSYIIEVVNCEGWNIENKIQEKILNNFGINKTSRILNVSSIGNFWLCFNFILIYGKYTMLTFIMIETYFEKS